VLVDPERLLAYGVALDEVLEAAAASNRNVSGGIYRSGGGEVLIRGIGRARGLDEIGLTVVAVRDGVPVLIEDLAEVRIGPRVRFGTASVNAEPASSSPFRSSRSPTRWSSRSRIEAELDASKLHSPRASPSSGTSSGRPTSSRSRWTTW